MLLKNKVALITGASSGIGRAIAQRFIKEGAQVIVFGRNKPDYKVEFHKVDVSKEEEIKKAIGKIKKLDILVNNAGILFMEPIGGSTEKFDKTINVNLRGAYLMSKHAVPLIKKSKGNIINISSIISVVPAKDAAAYCISKAGINMLTKILAQENAPLGVRVNAIMPGPIDTNMLSSTVGSRKEAREEYGKSNPMGRIGKPEEIAATAAFLASDEASYINGALLQVDGGELCTGSA